jgi:hypothetical protein
MKLNNPYNFWDEGTFEMAVERCAIDNGISKWEARDVLLELCEESF